jgi:nitroreductase
MITDLILKNRSYRRFFQNETISLETLRALVNLARLSASARNAQPLKYMIVNNPVENAIVFSYLAWAAYLTNWKGPEEGERPSAYIIMLGDTHIATNYWCDHGIAAQSILLGAVEQGLGGCIIASIQRELLKKDFEISDQYEIIQIIALGKPKEVAVIDPIGTDSSIKYWRDENQIHHVPKRSLDEIIIKSSPLKHF